MSDEGCTSRTIAVTVNGQTHRAEAPVRLTLGDFLRQSLKLTGTHLGCEHGVCGACTVLVDGRAMRSCLMLAVQADGHAVTTIEGLAAADAISGNICRCTGYDSIVAAAMDAARTLREAGSPR
jgi:carbon-monoxide dehydrogenase small subunit